MIYKFYMFYTVFKTLSRQSPIDFGCAMWYLSLCSQKLKELI